MSGLVHTGWEFRLNTEVTVRVSKNMVMNHKLFKSVQRSHKMLSEHKAKVSVSNMSDNVEQASWASWLIGSNITVEVACALLSSLVVMCEDSVTKAVLCCPPLDWERQRAGVGVRGHWLVRRLVKPGV